MIKLKFIVKSRQNYILQNVVSATTLAHVGKNVLAVDEQEKFIDHMTKQYQDMLRTHMADPTV